MTKDAARKTLTMAGAQPQNLEISKNIQRRAYELYEERGWADGHDLDDWLRAEEQITQQSRHRRRVIPCRSQRRRPEARGRRHSRPRGLEVPCAL